MTDESNYEYEREGKKVFTTAYFREQRELLSAEQFESEFQQQPFEAKGLLFNKDELNYFFELPKDRDPDTIIAVGVRRKAALTRPLCRWRDLRQRCVYR